MSNMPFFASRSPVDMQVLCIMKASFGTVMGSGFLDFGSFVRFFGSFDFYWLRNKLSSRSKTSFVFDEGHPASTSPSLPLAFFANVR